MKDVVALKKRIFGLEEIVKNEVLDSIEGAQELKFDIREIFEEMLRKSEQKNLVVLENKQQKKHNKIPDKIFIDEFVESEPNIVLYKSHDNVYVAYARVYSENTAEDNNPEEDIRSKGMKYVKSDIIIRRVPEYILGVGVLGRAFIFENYIEILDTLVGHDYQEVLKHEQLHIAHPEYSEIRIREITKNYMPNARYN
ncbi:MAG: hypothetical protein KKF44_01400 [Nanoarchaeota archaeon]|nr:hypothetical protein [Nanoarchaeota archaeon]